MPLAVGWNVVVDVLMHNPATVRTIHNSQFSSARLRGGGALTLSNGHRYQLSIRLIWHLRPFSYISLQEHKGAEVGWHMVTPKLIITSQRLRGESVKAEKDDRYLGILQAAFDMYSESSTGQQAHSVLFPVHKRAPRLPLHPRIAPNHKTLPIREDNDAKNAMIKKRNK